MNTNKRKEIECLARLHALSGALDDVLEFLVSEKLIAPEAVKEAKLSPETPKVVHQMLADLSTTEKVQLLEYEWTILPVERIKILFVTDRNSKEFTYNF